MATYYLDENGKLTNKNRGRRYILGDDGELRLIQENFNADGNNTNTWLKEPEMFTDNDGVKFTDALLAIVGTVGDVGVHALKGATGFIEGAGDLLTYAASGVTDFIGADDASKTLKDIAQFDAAGSIFDPLAKEIDPYSVLGDKSDSISEGLGQVGTMIATGGASAAAGLGKGGVSALTTGLNFASAAGSGMNEAYKDGASDKDAFMYGIINGAGEAGSELLFGGLSKASKSLGIGTGLLNVDDALAKKVGSVFSKQWQKNLAELGVKAGAEGTEELLSGVVSAFGKSVTYMSDEEFSTILENEDLLDQFISGAIVSGIAQSGYVPGMKSGSLREANKTGRDLVTGLSINEQKVVDKEVENRISERETDGTKLSRKEKNAIKTQVQNDLEKGYISIDSIESILGGDTYNNYKSITDKETKLQEEIKTLEDMPNAQITVKQNERLQEARKELDEIKNNTDKTQLKERLSKEVSDMTANDIYLRESYNEKTRRSQKFEADLSKYDKGQQSIIKKAIDSGILNNTNRTHEFVDMIAKISADKGVSFDFTDNQKLKESGFAVDGKTINGYVKGNNITLNINSNEALNKVVGHEITHVLEGTELYTELQQLVKEYAQTKGEYDSRYKALENLYKGIENTNIESELTADLIGEYVFSDSDFVNNLSTQKPNIFKRIYEEIKYLYKLVTARSKEARQLEKVKRAFDEAYKKKVKISEKGIDDIIIGSKEMEDEKLYQFVKDVYDNKTTTDKFRISEKIPENLANEIEEITGVSVKDYVNEIDANHVRHILKRHGENGSGDVSMKDIHDIAKIGYVIDNYDEVRKGKRKNKEYKNSDQTWSEIVEIKKKIGDKYYYVVEAVPDSKRKTLNVISAYINEKDTFQEVVEKSSNQHALDDLENIVSFSDRISETQNNVNTSKNNIGSNEFKAKDLIYEEPAVDYIATSQVDPKILELAEALGQNSEPDYTPNPENFGKKIETVQDRNAAKLENYKVELEKQKKLKENSLRQYNRDIADLQDYLKMEKDQNSQDANTLKMKIEEKKTERDDVQADYEKRINTLQERIKKMNTPEFKTAEQRQQKNEEYRTLLSNLMGDTSTWKDKSKGWKYQVNTLKRNLRDVVRDENGNRDIAKADAIYEELQGKYNQNEAKLNREANEINKTFADMKITDAEDVYIQMLGEYRHNPDTTIIADKLNDFYEKNKNNIDKEKVDKVIDMARNMYDNLFVRVNEVLKEQGMKEIPYREGYFPHFTDEQQGFFAKLFNWKKKNSDIPTDIAGLTENFKPNRSWQSFNKRRTGDVTDYSFKKGLDRYVPGALDWIYHIEDIQKNRAFENEIRYRHSDQGIKDKIDAVNKNEDLDAEEVQAEIDKIYGEKNNPLNNFVTDLRTRTNLLAGKKHSMDRGMEQTFNRDTYSTMTNISNRVTANMVGGSISSALTNFIPITQSWGEVSPISSLKAMRETLISTLKDDGTINKSDFLTNRLRQTENLYQSKWDKIVNKAGIIMDAIDSFTSQTVWRSKYNENISQGMSENEAIKNADEFAEGVMAGRSRGNMPTAFSAKNPLAKVLTAFQLEVANQYGYMFKDLPQAVKEKNTLRLAKAYGAIFFGAYAYNALYSSLTGRDAAFDPIGILEDLLNDLFGDAEDKEPKDAIVNLADNILDEVPFIGNLVGGGRIPISSALPYDGNLMEALEGTLDKGLLTKEWLNPAYYLALPVGGGQIKKLVEGLSMFKDDLPVSGSYTNNGNLRFAVEDNAINRLQAAIFGQWASANAQDYIENERQPLKEKQIQEFAKLDIPMKDYWEYRERLKDQSTIEEKFDYIAGLDLPVEKKNIMINNIVNREQEVDLSNYDDFSEYAEFDFYVKNPEKYTVSKAIGSFQEYSLFTNELNGIESDKDENGDTINGSRKEKVMEYINSLDIDYGPKIILYKSEYPADDTYNTEIIDYLNEREDISYSDMETILKELGFTVEPDGTVRWD